MKFSHPFTAYTDKQPICSVTGTMDRRPRDGHMEEYTAMRILHMSDLHIGMKAGNGVTEETAASRNHYLADMPAGLHTLTKKHPLDYIFVTGDIAYTGAKEEYEEAGDWLCKISRACHVPVERIYLCPGNHDRNRNTGDFGPYESFCRKMGFPCYELDGEKSYLAGVAGNRDLNVVCLNTVGFVEERRCQDERAAGLALLKLVKREKKYVDRLPVIVIMHHPFSLWSGTEENGERDMADAYCGICSVSDMILTGHTHETADGYGYRNGAYVCGNGACLKDGGYHHNFHIYETGKCSAAGTDCLRTVYEYCGNGWRKKSKMLRLETKCGKRSGYENGLQRSFSVLWWMRLDF